MVSPPVSLNQESLPSTLTKMTSCLRSDWFMVVEKKLLLTVEQWGLDGELGQLDADWIFFNVYRVISRVQRNPCIK